MSSIEKIPRNEIQEMLKHRVHEAIASVLTRDTIVPSCISCVHFHEPGEQCRLFNARPPARIIAHACDSYMDNLEVPF